MSLYSHVPHPHLKRRADAGAPTVAQVVADHPSLNMRLAAWGTRKFGSMPAFYLFVVYGALGAIFVKYQATLLYWSNWIQLWSLPLLMVGGIVLGMAHDKMAQQQFDDTEALLHEQAQTAQHLAAQDEKILAILTEISLNTQLTEDVKAVLAARAEHDSTVAGDAKAARTAAESAFVATQALAAVAVAKPGAAAS